MARWESHVGYLRGIPSGDDVAAAKWVGLDPLNQILDLVDGARPVAPAGSVHRPKISFVVRPFIPDMHPVLLQVAHVRIAFEKPKQLMDHRLPMDLLGRQQRESVRQIIDHLLPKEGRDSRPSAVGSPFTFGVDLFQEVEINLLVHGCGGMLLS